MSSFGHFCCCFVSSYLERRYTKFPSIQKLTGAATELLVSNAATQRLEHSNVSQNAYTRIICIREISAEPRWQYASCIRSRRPWR